MWSEALSVIDRAERLHRQFFNAGVPNWEPPADVVEAGDELRVHIALPGVQADSITIALDPDGVIVSALRPFPCRGEDAYIHRVEIPYGRFERRIPIAMDELELAGKQLADGVLVLAFRRKEGA
jgi:HSP20 family molecular chaperone IbpA